MALDLSEGNAASIMLKKLMLSVYLHLEPLFTPTHPAIDPHTPTNIHSPIQARVNPAPKTSRLCKRVSLCPCSRCAVCYIKHVWEAPGNTALTRGLKGVIGLMFTIKDSLTTLSQSLVIGGRVIRLMSSIKVSRSLPLVSVTGPGQESLSTLR